MKEITTKNITKLFVLFMFGAAGAIFADPNEQADGRNTGASCHVGCTIYQNGECTACEKESGAGTTYWEGTKVNAVRGEVCAYAASGAASLDSEGNYTICDAACTKDTPPQVCSFGTRSPGSGEE
jgi:hypothetical protein